jgi:hypothetical protein
MGPKVFGALCCGVLYECCIVATKYAIIEIFFSKNSKEKRHGFFGPVTTLPILALNSTQGVSFAKLPFVYLACLCSFWMLLIIVAL